MTSILCVLALAGLIGFMVYFSMLQPCEHQPLKKQENAVYIMLLLAVAFAVRLIGAGLYYGHKTDMNCFSAWADMVFQGGFSNFYNPETFTDYPPGYMYILYVLGAVKHVLPLSETATGALLKLPAILCDLGAGYLIYRIAQKQFNLKEGVLLSAFYLFNPAIIMNSAIWGQVDAVYTLLLMVMVYLITEKKMIPAYFAFALCIFIKPQALMFTPLIIFGIIEHVFLNNFNTKTFFKNLLWGLGAIALLFLLALPFGLTKVIEQYQSTLASYPYLTVNAFNIWGAMDKNWTALTLPTTILGYVLLAVIVAYAAYVFFKTKNPSKYYFLGALICLCTYMFSTKMHDRYAFPVMALLLLAYISVPRLEIFVLYLLSALAQFFNVAWILFIYETDINKYAHSPVIIIASIINIFIWIYLVYTTQKLYVNNQFTLKAQLQTQKKKQPAFSGSANGKKELIFQKTKAFAKMTKADIIILLVIMGVYSAVALYDLGNMDGPETFVTLTPNNAVTLDLGKETQISDFKYYLGPSELNEDRYLSVDFLNGDKQQLKNEKKTSGSVFYWNNQEESLTARYITLSGSKEKIYLMELAILDESGEAVTPVNAASYPELFDEQSLIPDRTNFRNSTYFDEIYHARTGYEFVHHLPVYEWTHPPLGKVFISWGIQLFGMCPFGWRIAGVVFGIFMIPIIYLFSKKLFRHTWLSAVTCLLFTFDFMHFAQTRIATIDVYGTFFIMLMYYFMFKYYSMSFYDTKLSKTFVPLGLAGICMGLGAASKWTGIYAGIGLGVIFLIILYRRYREYLHAKEHPSGESDGISHQFVLGNFKGLTLKTIGFCCIFFIAVPVLIYCAAYIPYLQTEGAQGFKTIWENQTSMYTYHSKTVLDATHAYSSRWFQWPIMTRPIWYYSGTVADGVKEGISSFGNPLVWWLGIPAFFYMVYLAFGKKDKKALFLTIGYLAQIVSWIPITRLTFIYHYFPSVPFVTLMLGYSILSFYRVSGKSKAVIYGAFAYAGLAIVLFIMFYPVLSGQVVDVSYVDTWLKWFKSWVLI